MRHHPARSTVGEGAAGAGPCAAGCPNPCRDRGRPPTRLVLARAERLGPTDDLHDLGGDRVLTGPVHDDAEVLDELVGVVGCRLHRPLTERVLGGRSVEQRGVHARLDVARQQRLEDRRRVGLELVVGSRAVVAPGLAVTADDRLLRQRHERTQHDLLAAGRDEAGVDELDLVDRARSRTARPRARRSPWRRRSWACH